MKLGPTKELDLNSAIRPLLNALENDVMGGAVRMYPRIKNHVPINKVNCVRSLEFFPLVCNWVFMFFLLLRLNHWEFSIFRITFHKIFRISEIFDRVYLNLYFEFYNKEFVCFNWQCAVR